MQNPYEGKVERNESPFKGFLGRSPKFGTWWFGVSNHIKSDLEKRLNVTIEKNSITAIGWKGIVVDANLFRVTGANKEKTRKSKSNLCSPLQPILKVVEETYANGQRVDTKLVGIGNWGKDIKDVAVTGKYTKVIAVNLLEVVTEDGTVLNMNNTLVEVRIPSKQMWLFGQWQKENQLDDMGMYGGLIGTNKKDDFFDEEYSYASLKFAHLAEGKAMEIEPVISSQWKEVAEYIENSAPGKVAKAPKEEEDMEEEEWPPKEEKPYTNNPSHPLQKKDMPTP